MATSKRGLLSISLLGRLRPIHQSQDVSSLGIVRKRVEIADLIQIAEHHSAYPGNGYKKRPILRFPDNVL